MKRSVGWGANEGRYWFFNVHVISCVLMACIDVCRCISLPTIQQFTVIHTVHRKYSFSFFPSAHWRQSKSSRQNVKGTWRRISLSTFFIFCVSLSTPFFPHANSLCQTLDAAAVFSAGGDQNSAATLLRPYTIRGKFIREWEGRKRKKNFSLKQKSRSNKHK